MLPTLTRHLQIQFQQIADASEPDQASANSIPASCRCFQPQDRHLQIQYQQIADASNPDQASTNPIPANCRCFRTRPGICKFNSSKLQMLPIPTRHLQIQFQLVADASNPDQASAAPILANCRYFRPRPGICKSNTSKLQILPHPEFTPICICKSKSSKLQILPTPTRHLQIQYQQIADASNPDQASTSPISANCRCFQPQDTYLQIQIQQVADTTAPQNNKSKMPTGELSSQIRRWASLFHLYCISISSNSYICLFLIRRGLSRPVSWHLFWAFPVFHRFPYALLWKSLPTRPLLLLSVPDGFCPR